MPISKFIPVAASVGVIAAIWMIISAKVTIGSYALIPWVPFLSWALVFGAGGGKFSRLPKEIIGLAGGTIAGAVVVLLMAQFNSIFGATLGVPVLVFLAAFIIVMLELTDLFELAPAYFYSFAGFFAYLFGGFAGTAEVSFPLVAVYLVLLLIGTGLGVITVLARGVILDMLKVPQDQRQTVFDKEKRPMAPEAQE